MATEVRSDDEYPKRYYGQVKKSGVLIVFGVLSFYFTINAIKGDRGFFKYLYLKGKVEAAQAERTKYAMIKKIWNTKLLCFQKKRSTLIILKSEHVSFLIWWATANMSF